MVPPLEESEDALIEQVFLAGENAAWFRITLQNSFLISQD